MANNFKVVGVVIFFISSFSLPFFPSKEDRCFIVVQRPQAESGDLRSETIPFLLVRYGTVLDCRSRPRCTR
ncbi:hypothetical protein HOY82DRAFT_323653 [Tuber indicum]|nr:hypothetical protein HOY82DRAFT_323653 [Tuber indicum]